MCVKEDGEDALVFVRAKPRASRSRVIGEQAGELEVALSAPPVDGAANSELLKVVAKALGIAKGRLGLERGETSRHKVVRVRGVSADEVRAALVD